MPNKTGNDQHSHNLHQYNGTWKTQTFQLVCSRCAVLWIKPRTLGTLPHSWRVTSSWNYALQGLKESNHQLRSPCPARLSFRIQEGKKGLSWKATSEGSVNTNSAWQRGLKKFCISKRKQEDHGQEKMGSKSHWRQESNIINLTNSPPPGCMRALFDTV